MNVIDIICFAMIILLAFFGVIKGFFYELVHFLAYVLSFIAAKIACVPLSDYLYSAFIKNKALSKLQALLPSGSVSGGLNEVKRTLLNTLPDKLMDIVRFFRLDAFMDNGSSSHELLTVAQIEQDYIMPIVTKVLSILTFILLFILLSIILRLVAAALNKVLFKKKDGLLSTTNKIFGGILGLIKGAVPAACICLILNLLASLINVKSFTAAVEGSMLCGFIAKLIG